tara:strand:+ start:4823 stop:5134 length:312 start_codon:yes stop_codon:yes gene_type:complete
MEETKIKYFKPEGFKGRGLGNKSYKKNKWEAIVFDKDTNSFSSGKYPTKEKLIEDLSLDISPDQIYRLVSGARVDKEKTKKKSSFLTKFGHIQITKISESSVE